MFYYLYVIEFDYSILQKVRYKQPILPQRIF